MEEKTIQLRGSMPRAPSWVRIKETGELEAEYYDLNAQLIDSETEPHLLTVAASKLPAVLAAMGGRADTRTAVNDLLLERIDSLFATYFELQNWLKVKGVPFQSHGDLA